MMEVEAMNKPCSDMYPQMNNKFVPVQPVSSVVDKPVEMPQ
jgi:hypothetical protein